MVRRLSIILAVSLGVNVLLAIALLPKTGFVLPFQKVEQASQANSPGKITTIANPASDEVFNEINPQSGYELKTSYGELGPKMLKAGVIDLEKFKAAYKSSGQSLTADQEVILTKGSNQKIKITRENAYFLLNFFWAVGLANNSKILTSGEIVKYGGEKDLGNFASTGGWTLGQGNAMNYYSKSNLIILTPNQEDLVQAVASQIYRPCCNNSTAFPDCNHGMALLGILELMAANGASQDEMFQASKYINAFWFPANYYDLASYFKNKENKAFKDIEPRLLLSKDYSSASGWQAAKTWLVEAGIVQEPPKSGGSCGV